MVSTYVYDALNRNTTVNYSDTGSINPDITRIYDTATNGKGRLHHSYAGGDATNGANVEHTATDSYDALGRPTVQRQLFKTNSAWSPTYQTSLAYNLAGGVTTHTYPSSHMATYTYDNAGRAESFSGNLDGTPRTYSTGMIYSSLGGMTKEQFGTDTALYNKSFYNSRGQLAEIRVSTSYTGPTDTSWNRGSIINHFSNQCWGKCGGSNSTQSMSDNNGNLKKQHVDIPDNEQVSSYVAYTSWFDYDQLNRLQFVNGERWASGPNIVGDLWKQTYIYDRWGNRRIDTNSSNTFGVGVNNLGFEVEAATNRLYSTGDLALSDASRRMRYDEAGNLKHDTYTGAGTRTYDAENRMKTAWGGNNQQQEYTYNADGQRTRRKVDTVETWQVYGLGGELLAEYPANGAANAPTKEYGYRNGQLLITAAPSSGSGSTQNVSWTNAVGVSVSGNSLTKTAANAWGNGGAASTQTITSGDGYVEFSASTTGDSVIGLGNGDPDQSYNIGFTIHVDLGNASIWEAGVWKVNVGTYAASDRFQVAIESGVVKYRKNGSLLYTSTVAPSYPLLVDTALYLNGSTLTNVVITAAPPSGSQSVSWTNAVGVSVSSNSLTKTAANAWGNAGAASTQTITSGDGYVEFSASTTGDSVIGLGNGDPDQNYSIAFSIHVDLGAASVWEAGVYKAALGSYAASDRFQVAIESGVVKYRKNGSLLYTSTVAPSYPLLVDTALYLNGSTLTNAVISGNLSGGGSGGSTINWLISDQLGTPRMILDQTGSLANMKRHDYLPFGEELFAGTGGRTTGQGYVGDTIRQKFTSKERDIETGLDYFLARYYSSTQGRFTSVDPLMASGSTGSPQSWNRYSYCYNNPLRFTDPSGMLAGDFYNEEGKRLGTDGLNDGKVYVVTDKAQAKQIQGADKTGGTTQLSAVSSAVELPGLDVRQAIGSAVERSNSPTSDDKKGGFHEEGVTWGTNASGAGQVIAAAPGPVSNPLTDTHAQITLSNFANPADNGALVTVGGTAHIHPKGVMSVTTGAESKPGVTVIGGTTTTTTGSFNQPPSGRDIGNAMSGQTHIVVGARDKKVYVYGTAGVRATFPLKQFLSIGRK